MQRKELGIAVVGSGRIGTLRARLAAKYPSVSLLAVSDRDPWQARINLETTIAIERAVATGKSIRLPLER